MNKKCLIFGLLIILMLSAVSPVSIGYSLSNTLDEENIFYVGGSGEGNYSSIQDAIDAANAGDTIYVYNNSSPYCEVLTIDKKITLIGEDRDSTIIDGCNSNDDGITINVENVTIESLTVKNFRSAKPYSPWDQAGIKTYSSNVRVTNCKLDSNRMGVEVYTGAYNITIKNNIFLSCSIMLANYFKPGQMYSDVTLLDFIHNIECNTVNGLPLYYITDTKDYVVPSDAGQIILVNCTNAILKDFELMDNGFPFFLAYCSGCLLENLTIHDTYGEGLLIETSDSIIQNNTIYNTFKALCLEDGSNNNIIRYNTVYDNLVGLSIYTDSHNNSVYKNEAYNNLHAGMEIVTNHGGVQRDNNISENSFYNNKIGIHLYTNSIYNLIENNDIKNNVFGILLQEKSCGNKILNNNLQRNLISSMFLKCGRNTWNGNYWKRPRVLPKPIFGLGVLGMPRVYYDMHPSLKLN